MSLNLDDNSATTRIQGYKPGVFKINDMHYGTSLLLNQTQLIQWRPQNLNDLTPADMQVILNLKPDILILGTGETLIFPELAIYGELINAGIGVEIMNTQAGARTFNALISEGRNVAAALLVK
jgi:uncharacterized protein